MQERGQAQGLAASELVGQRLRQHGLQARGQRPEELLQAGLELELAGQHLQRVPVHVEVVVPALLHVV